MAEFSFIINVCNGNIIQNMYMCVHLENMKR